MMKKMKAKSKLTGKALLSVHSRISQGNLSLVDLLQVFEVLTFLYIFRILIYINILVYS